MEVVAARDNGDGGIGQGRLQPSPVRRIRLVSSHDAHSIALHGSPEQPHGLLVGGETSS
jgi:hypothetical protein